MLKKKSKFFFNILERLGENTKSVTFLLFFAFLITKVTAQDVRIDSLRKALNYSKNPSSARMEVLKSLSNYYIFSRPDSAIIFGQEGYNIAISNNAKNDANYLLNIIAFAYLNLGDYTKSLSLFFKLKEIYRENNDQISLVKVLNDIGVAFDNKGDYLQAISFSKLGLNVLTNYESNTLLKQYSEKETKTMLLLNIGNQFTHLNKLDSASHYLSLSHFFLKKYHIKDDVLVTIYHNIGEVEKRKGNKTLALQYFRKAIPLSISNQDLDNLSLTYLSMADLFHRYKNQDSSKYYGKKALEIAEQSKLLQDELKASETLLGYYEEEQNTVQAYQYLKLTTAIKDSLFSQNKIKQLLALDFEERQREREIEIAKEAE